MRPKIICHMISSIDGRLQPSRWTSPVDGISPDLKSTQYEDIATRINADGWMVGRVTMQGYAKGHPTQVDVPTGDLRTTFVAPGDHRTFAVAIDPEGKLEYGRNRIGQEHIVAVIGLQVSDNYLARLRNDGVSYLFAGADGHDLANAMGELGAAFGIETILLEGGGVLNGVFLKAALIDEISVLVYPGIDGLAGISSIFEYHGKADELPAKGQRLRHTATETLDGGTVWLRYTVERE